MFFTSFIRGIVRKNPNLKLKLKKAGSRQTAFQYVYQTVSMTILSTIAVFIIVFLVTQRDPIYLLFGVLGTFLIVPLLYRFWFSYVEVQITKAGRELDWDLLFVSEYFLVSLESGLPLGNAIANLSKLKRPGGRFFKKVYTEFNTGKDLEQALNESADFCPSDTMKILLKRLKDSLNIGVDLKSVLENFVNDASEKKILDIRAFSKKLNPTIMMYLLLGIVLPSLGVTFFILAAAILEMTTELLKIILIFIFLLMFGFQYISYTIFKFSKSTI